MDEIKGETKRERERKRESERNRESERDKEKDQADKRDTLHCVFRKHTFRLSHTYSYCRRYRELFMKYFNFCEEIHFFFRFAGKKYEIVYNVCKMTRV